MNYSKLLLSFSFLLSISYSFSQCSGLQIIGFNSDDPDQILFEATEDIPAGTVFHFTDNAWDDGSEAFVGTTEGERIWTAPLGGVASGSKILWEGTSVTCGSVDGTVLSLSASGEGIYILSVVPSTMSGSVTASDICFYALFGDIGSTTGITSVNLGNFDNAYYNDTGDITDPANWTINNSILPLPAASCSSIPTMCIAPQFTATATCANGATAATFDNYYVSVEVTNAGSASGDVNVVIGSQSIAVSSFPSTVVLGPFSYVDGLAAQTVTVSDATDASCSSTGEVSELRCGYTPDNGLGTPSDANACGTFCTAQGSIPTANLPALIAQAAPDTIAQGATNITNYVYVLVAGGNIVTTNNSGLFSSLTNGTAYTVHAFNVLETDRASFESQFVVGNAYAAPTSGECFSFCGSVTKTPDCFTCPTISALTATSPICTGTTTTDLDAIISGFDETENGDEDYILEFVYTTLQASTSTAVYALDATTTAVTQIGTVAITSAGVTTAAAPDFTLPTATSQTTYYVYTRILNGTTVIPDATCRPFAETTIVVNPLPSLTAQTPALCANNGTDYDNLDLTSYESAIGIPAILPTTPMSATVVWYMGNGTTGTNITSSANDQDGVSNGDIFTIEYTNENGCVNTATVTVAINPVPVLTSQTATFCATATNGVDYDNLDLTSYESPIGIPAVLPSTPMQATVLWYEGNGTSGTDITSTANDQDGVSNGDIFTIEYTNENGCVNTATVTVTINPLPVATLNDPTVCMSSTTAPLTLTVVSGTPTMYAIDYDDASITDISTTSSLPTEHTIPATLTVGGYSGTITYTDGNGCSGTDVFTITVQAASDPGTNGVLSLCNADPSEYNFNLFDILGDSPSTTGTWAETTSGTSSGVSIGTGNTGEVSMQNVIASTYEFTYTIAATGSCPAVASTVAVTVTNCFDLALTKVLTTTGVVKPGDNVTFDVSVINQGDVIAYDVDIEDLYNSAELTFVSAAISPNDASSSTGSAVTDGFTIDQIAVGGTAIVQITMTINSSFTGNVIVNNAEITGGASVDGGSDALDEDSTPNSEDGSMTDPNDNDTGMTDGSDDYDPASVMVCQSNCGAFPWDGTN